MAVSTPMLGLGLMLTGLGAALLLMSFRRGEKDNGDGIRTTGVIFIGPIPIILSGKGRWVTLGVVAVITFVVLLAVANAQPELIGW
ncbi:MAG TPA: DUF131 domain-containing protein [Patescibacteria group bacterium]|nr:DUF131 domain-containing protein [Patescibacteria group bacterium]